MKLDSWISCARHAAAGADIALLMHPQQIQQPADQWFSQRSHGELIGIMREADNWWRARQTVVSSPLVSAGVWLVLSFQADSALQAHNERAHWKGRSDARAFLTNLVGDSLFACWLSDCSPRPWPVKGWIGLENSGPLS